jgi:hypothetical protein
MEFRVIDGYPYEIYNDGRVFRIERKSKSGRTLHKIEIRPHRLINGYLIVRLYCNKTDSYKKWYLHRLVWTAFNCEIPDGMEIDHSDGDRQNCAISNLQAVTHKQNCSNEVSRERYKRANALDKGKFNRERMQQAKSEENKERLRREYISILEGKGSVGVYAFMKAAHCNYYTALKIKAEVEGLKK